ncbi:MAG TPA: hypothetical protein VGL22_17745 [Terracidiphilus sp.]
MWADLSDGLTIGLPLAWFPRLLRARPGECDPVRLRSRGCIGMRSTRMCR